jgi:tetratricopeptide (TPR) repeat protein
MAKVVKFPQPTPEKFGFKPVRKRRENSGTSQKQLNLFAGGRVVKLGNLTTFEEALILDEQANPQAKALYLKAIEEGDCVADAYCNLGILESQDNHHSQAIDYLTMGLKHDPRHFEAHYNLANLYAEVGNLLLAKVHYQMAIQVEPDFPNAHFNLGLTLAMLNESKQAVEELYAYKRLSEKDDLRHVDELIATISLTKTS